VAGPLRILLASYGPDNEYTGLGKWTHRMAAGLRTLGHRATTWFQGDFPAVRRTGRLAVAAFPVALARRVLARRDDFDVIAVHEPSGLWCTYLRGRIGRFPPVVIVCHNVESKVWSVLRTAESRGHAASTPWGWLTAPLLRHWQSDGAIRRADAVVCLSEEDRDYLSNRGLRPAGDVRVIPNGADPSRARGVPAGAPAVLVVGGWLDVKGRRVLPAIWSAVRRVVPSARLTLAGTGAAPEAVLAEFPEADRNSVRVLPAVADPSEMATLYATHGILLLPSLSEGSPLAVLEAMAASLPVVGASVGGVPDLVRHEREALLFPAMDSAGAARHVVRLLSDPSQAAGLAERAEERVRDFTWSRAARAFAEVLERSASAVRGSRR